MRGPRRRFPSAKLDGDLSRTGMKSTPSLTPVQLALVAFGAIVLGHALEMSDGFYSPVALGWTLLPTLFVLAGTARVGGKRGRETLVSGVLVAGLLSNLLALATSPVGMYLRHPLPAH